MRIVSQDGDCDAPYDSMVIEVDGYNVTIEPYDSALNKRVIGKYSSNKKALNVVKMIRKHNDSCCTYLTYSGISCVPTNKYFQMPQDEEVED